MKLLKICSKFKHLKIDGYIPEGYFANGDKLEKLKIISYNNGIVKAETKQWWMAEDLDYLPNISPRYIYKYLCSILLG